MARAGQTHEAPLPLPQTSEAALQSPLEPGAAPVQRRQGPLAVQLSTLPVAGSQAVAPAAAQPAPTFGTLAVAGQAQAALPFDPWQVWGDAQAVAAPRS